MCMHINMELPPGHHGGGNSINFLRIQHIWVPSEPAVLPSQTALGKALAASRGRWCSLTAQTCCGKSGVLCPVLSHPLQDRHVHTRLRPVMGHKEWTQQPSHRQNLRRLRSDKYLMEGGSKKAVEDSSHWQDKRFLSLSPWSYWKPNNI